MAVAALPYKVEYIWKDREGTFATTSINIQNRPVLAADVQAKAAALVPLLKALSSCHLVAYRVISRYADPAVAGAGEAERKGKFTFTTAQGSHYTTMVPGFKDGLLDANGRDITVKGASVRPEITAFVNAIVNGPAGWANGPVNEAGLDIIAALYAKKVHVRSLARRAGRSG